MPDGDPVIIEGESGRVTLTPEEIAVREAAGTLGGAAISPEALAASRRQRVIADVYGGVGQKALTGFEGLASGATLGLSRLAFGGVAGPEYTEESQFRREAHPLTAGGGELVGDVSAALLSGGTGTAAKLAGRGTLSGLLARQGERLATRAAPRLGQVGAQAAANAVEGAISAATQEAVERALADKPFSGEALVASGGRGLLLGGAIGGGFAGAGKGLSALLRRSDGAAGPTPLADALDQLPAAQKAEIEGAATGAAPVQDVADQATPKRRSLRSVVPLDERSREAVIDHASQLSAAIEDQATYARGVRRAVAAATPTLSPRQAAELAIAEQAYRDAVAVTRRQFKDFTRAISRGKMPALGEDVEGAANVLRRLEQTRADLDARLAGGAPTASAGAAPAPETPRAPLPKAEIPDGWATRPGSDVRAGVPGFNEVDPRATYVVKASDINDRVRDITVARGEARPARNVTTVENQWAGGKRVEAIEGTLRSDGTIELVEGNTRFSAALKGDRDVAIRLRRAAEDAPEGLEAVAGALGRIEAKTGASAPEWVRKGLARRAAKGESVVESMGGGPVRGISPRATDREVRFRREVMDQAGLPEGSYDPVTGEVLDVAEQIRPPRIPEQPAAPTAPPPPIPPGARGDAARALETILPGLPPPAATRTAGGIMQAAETVAGLSQALGIGLGPLGQLFAGYRLARSALARSGLIRDTAVAKTAARVTGVRNEMSRIVRGVVEKRTPGLARAVTRASVRATKDDLREVQALAGDPEAIEARIEADSPHAPPEVLLAAARTATRKMEYLAKVAPKPAWAGTPFAAAIEPTEMELARWGEIYAALDAPMDVISDLAEGRWNPETWEAVASVYPELVAGLGRQVMERLDELVARAPRGARLALGQALGMPLDGTQLDWYQHGVMTVGANQQATEPRASSYLPSASQSAELALTPSQRRAQR